MRVEKDYRNDYTKIIVLWQLETEGIFLMRERPHLYAWHYFVRAKRMVEHVVRMI